MQPTIYVFRNKLASARTNVVTTTTTIVTTITTKRPFQNSSDTTLEVRELLISTVTTSTIRPFHNSTIVTTSEPKKLPPPNRPPSPFARK